MTYTLDDILPAAGAGEFAFRSWFDGLRLDTLARLAAKANADHTHGEGGVVATIVDNEAALGTGTTNGELKWTLDGGFKMFFWDASAGKWGILAGRWATEPSPSTYTIETGTIVIIASQAKIYNGSAFTGLVDVSGQDALIAELQANLKRVETNLAIEAFNREIADSQTGLDPFMDGFSTIFGSPYAATNGIDTSESKNYLHYARDLNNQMVFGEDIFPLGDSAADYDRSNSNSYTCACEIDTNKWLIVYKGTDNYMYAVVATYDAGSVTYGSGAFITNYTQNSGIYFKVAKVDTDKDVVTFRWNSSGIYYQHFYVISVSGTTPSPGGSIYYTPGDSYQYAYKISQLATDKAVIFRRNSSGYAALQVVTVSGTSPSLGSERVICSASPNSNVALGYIDEDLCAVNYKCNSQNIVAVYSASGAVLTQVGVNQTQPNYTYGTPITACSMSTNHFVVFNQYSNSGNYSMYCYTYEVSGGTVTYMAAGTHQYRASGGDEPYLVGTGTQFAIKLSGTQVMVGGNSNSNCLMTSIFNVAEITMALSHEKTSAINPYVSASELAVGALTDTEEVIVIGRGSDNDAFGAAKTADENLAANIIFNEFSLLETPESARVIALVKDLDGAGAIASDIGVYHALGKVSITGINRTNPCEITCDAAHGLEDGDLALIVNAGGMTELNGRIVTVTSAGTNNFSCQGLDATGFTPFTSGGEVMTVSLSTLGLQGGFDGDVNVYAGDCQLSAVSGTTETRLAVIMTTDHGYEFSALAVLYK